MIFDSCVSSPGHINFNLLKRSGDIFLIFFLLLLISACQNTLPRDDIPRKYVYTEINLDDFKYNSLKLIGGFVYYDAGVRGIIIYKKSPNEYSAFERDCPYRPGDSCALVSVDKSTLYMIDSCCSSRFDFDGNPLAGPARFPLLQYSTFLNQNFLIISSD
jgi:hypothetical protein